MTAASAPAPPASFDLTDCDREPIQVPGAIQPHGVLLALAEVDGGGLAVAQVSANAAEHLETTPTELLAWNGTERACHLDALLDPASLGEVERALVSADPRSESPLRLVTSEACGGRSFDGILHRSGGLVVLELEPASAASGSFGDFYRRVRGAVSRLQRAGRVVQMCQLAVDEVAALTGFDRVMAYRFDRDEHGHVIAERKRADLESFLDLHYPAADIPVQARRLYTVNWLRLIADVGYRPAPLVPANNPVSGEPLDLSFAVLRSVSPIHVEYLANMGVGASMSVSLVVEGRLWGMIICHHDGPRFVPYEVRTACEFLGQALSWQVAARERADVFEDRARAQRILARLVNRFSGSSDFAGALGDSPDDLLRLVDATGAAVHAHGRWTTVGSVPPPAELEALGATIRARLESGAPDADDTFVSDRLRDVHERAQTFDAVASGALAISLTADRAALVVWFRPEVVQTVNWAGDPHKLASLTDGHPRLSPRGSFALWRETVRSRSLPWAPWAVEVARDLRRALVMRALRRTEELAALNAELETMVAERTAALTEARDQLAQKATDLAKSNTELERYAYVASHDLQEPLRMVVSYVQLLARRYQGKLDRDADEFIGFAVDGAKRMQTLINDLLAFSRIGRQDRPKVDVDLEELFARALSNLTVAIEEANAEITHDPLPTVLGDPLELGQVMQNLVGNALKFRGERPARLHVGVRESEREWTLSFRDEGIGIALPHLDRIFVIFQRLHTRTEYPGSGIGLAITKKVVEGHGGRIWAESSPGAGATFFLTLPRLSKPPSEVSA